MKRLAAATGMGRSAWPTSLCRRIWEALMEVEAGRRRSAVYEARWLNLLGFALRPGYGLAVDDWRVARTWTTLQGKFAHTAANVRVEGWILWRRIAGGLAAGQQQALAEPLLGPVRSLHRQLTSGKGRSDFGFATHETAEIWRLLGSLELVAAATKVELGDMILDLLPKRKMEVVRPAMVWAIGRLGAGSDVWPAEHRRAGRNRRRVDWPADRENDGRKHVGADAACPADRRPQPRRARKAPPRRARLAQFGRRARPFCPTSPRRRLAGHRGTGAGVRRIAADRAQNGVSPWFAAPYRFSARSR